jgi:hypothetical protein
MNKQNPQASSTLQRRADARETCCRLTGRQKNLPHQIIFHKLMQQIHFKFT